MKFYTFEIPEHQCEGFSFPVFYFTKLFNSFITEWIACKVHASKSFNGKDSVIFKHGNDPVKDGLNVSGKRNSLHIYLILRAAVNARYRLCMKSAVMDIF